MILLCDPFLWITRYKCCTLSLGFKVTRIEFTFSLFLGYAGIHELSNLCRRKRRSIEFERNGWSQRFIRAFKTNAYISLKRCVHSAVYSFIVFQMNIFRPACDIGRISWHSFGKKVQSHHSLLLSPTQSNSTSATCDDWWRQDSNSIS